MEMKIYTNELGHMTKIVAMPISWGERNTAVTQFLVTLQESQKTLPFCSILLFATKTYRVMVYKHKK